MTDYDMDPEDRGESYHSGPAAEAAEKTLFKSPNDKRQFPQTGEGVNMRKRLAMGQGVDVGTPQAKPAPKRGGRVLSNKKEYGGGM